MLGIGEDFNRAMEHLDDLQLELLGEGDERLELFIRWIDARPGGWFEESIISTSLFEQLRELHHGSDRHFPFRNSAALGTWLGRHKDLIHLQAEIQVEQIFIGHARGWKLSQSRREGVKDHNQLKYNDIIPEHAFTPHQRKMIKDASHDEVILEEVDLRVD